MPRWTICCQDYLPDKPTHIRLGRPCGTDYFGAETRCRHFSPMGICQGGGSDLQQARSGIRRCGLPRGRRRLVISRALLLADLNGSVSFDSKVVIVPHGDDDALLHRQEFPQTAGNDGMSPGRDPDGNNRVPHSREELWIRPWDTQGFATMVPMVDTNNSPIAADRLCLHELHRLFRVWLIVFHVRPLAASHMRCIDVGTMNQGVFYVFPSRKK